MAMLTFCVFGRVRFAAIVVAFVWRRLPFPLPSVMELFNEIEFAGLFFGAISAPLCTSEAGCNEVAARAAVLA